MAFSAQQLAREGARLMLISGERGLYTRLGNVRAMRFTSFTLKVPLSPLPSASAFATRLITESDLASCARLYLAEAVRFVRPVEKFQDALDHQCGWLIEQEGVPRAYLLLQTSWDDMGNPDQGIYDVTEYAGSRLALAAGLRQMLSTDAYLQPAIRELHMAIPWQDVDLLQSLEGINSQTGVTSLPDHTMRLLNFPALRQDLAAYIAARLPIKLRLGLRFEQFGPLQADPGGGEASDGRMAVAWKSGKITERLELSCAEMTALVMGGYGAQPELRGALAEIVPALFPLPSFLVGLNYQ
jgi:hypothetical protein